MSREKAYSEENIVEYLKNLGSDLGRRPSLSDVDEDDRYPVSLFKREIYFGGQFLNALWRAGYDISHDQLEKEEILHELRGLDHKYDDFSLDGLEDTRVGYSRERDRDLEIITESGIPEIYLLEEDPRFLEKVIEMYRIHLMKPGEIQNEVLGSRSVDYIRDIGLNLPFEPFPLEPDADEMPETVNDYDIVKAVIRYAEQVSDDWITAGDVSEASWLSSRQASRGFRVLRRELEEEMDNSQENFHGTNSWNADLIRSNWEQILDL